MENQFSMSDDLDFQIGDIVIRLRSEANVEFASLDRFAEFKSTTTPQVHYSISTASVTTEPSSSPVFDNEFGWRTYLESEQWIVWARTHYRNPYMVGRYSHDFHSGEIFTTESRQEPGRYVLPLSHPMGLHIMVNLLGTGYGLMLHSCGVVDGEHGIAFAGVSTAGKSTTARLWNGSPDAKVLNDDRNILRKINGQFLLYGTPWPGVGGFATAGVVPLEKLFILKHAPSNSAKRLSPAQAAAALLVRTFAPLWNAEAMKFTLQFLDELCQSIPCYELGFVPDQSAVEYVRCLPTG